MRCIAIICMCLPLGVLSGCLPGEPLLPSVPSGYVAVPVLTPSGRTRHSVEPEACLQPPDPSRSEMDAELPALGCANGHNLKRMAESESDLVSGRRMGDAAAAPTARAASNYLNGVQAPANPDPNAPAHNVPAANQTAPAQGAAVINK